MGEEPEEGGAVYPEVEGQIRLAKQRWGEGKQKGCWGLSGRRNQRGQGMEGRNPECGDGKGSGSAGCKCMKGSRRKTQLTGHERHASCPKGDAEEAGGSDSV